jgi:hypothetical protein
MKVRVTGLQSGTTYYFKTVTVSNEGVLVEPATFNISTDPAQPAAGVTIPSVTTENETLVFSNDQLVHKVYQSDGATPAAGALILAEVQGASYPVTGWDRDCPTLMGMWTSRTFTARQATRASISWEERPSP